MEIEVRDFNNFNWWAKKHILDDSKFDKDGYIIMKNKKNYKKTGIVARILEDKWNDFYKKYKDKLDIIRPNANEEVKKVIACANGELGASVYLCPICNEIYYCHHTCKGRLCSSCGIKTQNIQTENILERCINCTHRHITFTIPELLRRWFIDDLTTNNLLFEAACETLYSVVNGKYKKTRFYNLRYKPGFFAFLHTFGRPMNFNPHIHIIFAEYLINNGEFRGTKNQMYQKYPNGFYVNNKLEDDGIKFNSIEALIKYVIRYCSRPAIAESRILNYDGTNVKWCYTDHKKNEYHEIIEDAFSFIKRIIKHLLPHNFKSIRSYGFYNKPSKIPKDTNMLVSKEKINLRRQLLNWKMLIQLKFKRNPLMCPNCETQMQYCFEVVL